MLKVTSVIAAMVSAGFGFYQLTLGTAMWPIGITNVLTAAAFLAIPLLRAFGELVAPLVFTALAYGSLFFITWNIGTESGLLFYYPVAAVIVVLVLGSERIVLAGILAAVGVVMGIGLKLTAPADTGLQPAWSMTVGFILSISASALMAFAAVWFALRETARAEEAMEMEYERSEQLLANILPASIAARLKDPDHATIADRYDDASILFADIAGFTERASETAPCDLVAFLDRLYTEFDLLVDRHGLEKVKTSGDAYMVVSGVPQPRPDHVHALAALALDMADAVPRIATRRVVRCPSGSAWRAGRWSPAWWARAGSSTTSGATRSTSRPGWRPPTRPGTSRFRRASTNASAAISTSPNAAMSRSRARASCTPGIWWAGGRARPRRGHSPR